MIWLKIILNYKSYYEAFKLGVTDNGFTDVARLLFYPIFEEKNILDENLNPYDVDNANASAWGNGYKTIPKEIQAAVGKNEMLTKIITYFDSSVVPVLSDAIADEMYDAMKELVENCDLRDSKKHQLMKYYADCKYGEFLGRVFQRALLGNNKVSSPQRKKSASDAKSESIDEFNKLIRGGMKKPTTVVPDEIQPDELGYVSALYDAYEDAHGVHINVPADLDSIGCREHFDRQRKNYYLAETIDRKTRDSVKKEEDGLFDTLKDEVESGIYEISQNTYSNGLEKANTVLDRAGTISLSVNTQNSFFNWIGPGEKKGVCHMLVNDERLEWVDKDEK